MDNTMALLHQAGVTFVTGVADSAFKALIAELEQTEINHRYVLATREDNAIAMAAGAYLAGEQPLVFMESSGIGNAIDVLTSLVMVYRMPIVLLVAWAGYKGRDVPHHNAIGERLAELFQALAVPTIEISFSRPFPEVVQVIAKAVQQSNAIMQPVAVLGIPQKLDDDRENV
jgi:phosphonopyruvate decarboxylase